MAEWYEKCFCPTPLYHERQTQYDRYFTDVTTTESEGYGEIKGESLWDYMASKAEAVSISWTGQIARDLWNLFALKVLSRLAQAEQLNITVSMSGKLGPDQDVNALNDSLKQLGIEGEFKAGD